MKKVMCFGTFDILHEGHVSYLKQAKKYGDYLIVIVGLDCNVKRIKGRLPRNNETKRLVVIKKLDFVNKAVLGQTRDRFAVIKKYKPDIVCLGYDQKVNIKELKSNFFGRIIRLKSHRPRIYKSSKLKITTTQE
ncbi:MAG: FAD synthase [Patescibacteria group bacterium]|nr:FAD synthase [Patescibacteria group bacterium]